LSTKKAGPNKLIVSVSYQLEKINNAFGSYSNEHSFELI